MKINMSEFQQFIYGDKTEFLSLYGPTNASSGWSLKRLYAKCLNHRFPQEMKTESILSQIQEICDKYSGSLEEISEADLIAARLKLFIKKMRELNLLTKTDAATIEFFKKDLCEIKAQLRNGKIAEKFYPKDQNNLRILTRWLLSNLETLINIKKTLLPSLRLWQLAQKLEKTKQLSDCVELLYQIEKATSESALSEDDKQELKKLRNTIFLNYLEQAEPVEVFKQLLDKSDQTSIDLCEALYRQANTHLSFKSFLTPMQLQINIAKLELTLKNEEGDNKAIRAEIKKLQLELAQELEAMNRSTAPIMT